MKRLLDAFKGLSLFYQALIEGCNWAAEPLGLGVNIMYSIL